jgi:hypothetical protein
VNARDGQSASVRPVATAVGEIQSGVPVSDCADAGRAKTMMDAKLSTIRPKNHLLAPLFLAISRPRV